MSHSPGLKDGWEIAVRLIAMSERDLQRIEVLSKVVAARMTTVSAAHVLDLSQRQVRQRQARICDKTSRFSPKDSARHVNDVDN